MYATYWPDGCSLTRPTLAPVARVEDRLAHGGQAGLRGGGDLPGVGELVGTRGLLHGAWCVGCCWLLICCAVFPKRQKAPEPLRIGYAVGLKGMSPEQMAGTELTPGTALDPEARQRLDRYQPRPT